MWSKSRIFELGLLAMPYPWGDAVMLDPIFAGRRLLVVDDEYTIASTLKLIFQTRGFEVRAATSAEQGHQLIKGWEPDIAILDVFLPAMNGIDLAILLGTTCPGCKVILFSGQPRSGELSTKAAAEGHLFEVLVKPIHPEDLLSRTAKLLRPNPNA